MSKNKEENEGNSNLELPSYYTEKQPSSNDTENDISGDTADCCECW